MSADKILNPDVTVQAKVVAWLVNKSDTTILLFLLLYGVWVKSDHWLAAIQSGYDKNAAVMEKAVERMAAEHEKDRQFLVELLREQRVLSTKAAAAAVSNEDQSAAVPGLTDG